ncbi:MAG: P-loop NTPase, partial [Acidimicrobiales bacterium]
MASDDRALEVSLGRVIDPVLGVALSETGMLRSVRARRHRAEVDLVLPVEDWPDLDELVARVVAAGSVEDGGLEVRVSTHVMDDAARLNLRTALRSRMQGERSGDDHGHGHGHDDQSPEPAFLQAGSTTRVIGVSSGKGGVGKSSVTVNLAITLANAGHSVAILDADVYGFSIPKMLGGERDPVIIGDMVVPTVVHGVRCLSMGYFVPEDQPVIWRGPMLHKA